MMHFEALYPRDTTTLARKERFFAGTRRTTEHTSKTLFRRQASNRSCSLAAPGEAQAVFRAIRLSLQLALYLCPACGRHDGGNATATGLPSM